MKWFSVLNIRNKLILIIMAVSLTVVMLAGAARVIWDMDQSRKILVQQITTLSQLLGGRSSAALAFDNEELANENLSSLVTMPQIVQSCLYNNNGSLLAVYNRATSTTKACPVFNKINKLYQSFENDRLNMLTSIAQGKSTLGWIYISSDLSLIKQQQQKEIIFSLIALVAAALVSMLLAGKIQNLISAPIVEITKTARQIKEKEDINVRVKVSSEDEVGDLARTINSMLDALDAKNILLHRSQKMDALGKLTGGIAHDYNNMLGVILGYAELLSTRVEDQPELLKYVNHIHDAGERGARLTKKLLSFSRNKISHAEVLNINSILLGEQHMLEKTLTARVELIYSLEGELWNVNIDSSDMENAILNMSINASHAMGGSGKLKIKTTNKYISQAEAQSLQLESGDYALLEIADTGQGMDLQTIEKIFDPFYSTKGEKGTGLGLSQVYGFVKSSGGAIKVYSELGKGTRFLLYFPRSHINKSESAAVQLAHVNTQRCVEKILVVDDEKALGLLAKQILSENGYDVVCVESADEALAVLKTNHFDLLLSDVIMPGTDGFELAELVKEKYPTIKVQLASGFTSARSDDKRDDVLSKRLIEKPYSADVLLKKIRNLLDGK